MLTEDQKHYIGGIIDGDGCISSWGRNYSFCIVSSTDYDYVKKIRSVLNEYELYIKTYQRKNSNWKQEYQLTLSRRQDNLIPFIKEIEDYTVLKRPRIELLEKIIMNVDKTESMKKLRILNERGYNPNNIELPIQRNNEYVKPYIAGLMDSEGSFIIYKRNNRKDSYHYNISPLTSTSYELVKYIKHMLPYDLSIHERNRRNVYKNRRTTYETSIYSKDFINFIDDLYPYLILKRQHSKLFKNFRLGIDREETHLKLRQLNKRGTHI